MATDLTGAIIDGEVGDLLNQFFLSDFRVAGYRKYRGVTLPARHSDFADQIENFEVRNDDVWVMSYPKTGTTWTQEMAWCIANDLDFEGAKQIIVERFPFLDHSCLFDYTDILPKKPELVLPPCVENSITFVNKMKSPRFIKTHLPWDLLPKQIRSGEKTPKIIYVCRNAKDTCVSYYHHCMLLEGYKGSFEDFCTLFLKDGVCYSPFWEHISGFWQNKSLPNILFLKYEDMRKDLAPIIRQTGEFLGKTLSEDQVAALSDHLSFNSMKNNAAVNYEAVVEINRTFNLIPNEGQFMRKGTGGEWKAKMTPELISKFDAWIKENTTDKGMNVWDD